jgi:hypothetical protein
MNKQRRRRLFSVGLMLLALVSTTSIAGLTTFALYSDEAKNNGHINAGNLQVEFTRTKLFGLVPNEQNGLLEEMEDNTVVDLKTDTNDIFTIKNAVPGMSITAELELKNLGSVAFNSYVKIVDLTLGDGDIASASESLAEQLDIYLYTLDENNQKVGSNFKLSEYASSDATLEFSLINNGDSQKFYIDASLDSSVGNEVQNGQVTFDVHVDATQKTTA